MDALAKTRKLTQQQIALKKPLGKIVDIGRLSQEEIEYILLLMASFNQYRAADGMLYLEAIRNPPSSLGKANFSKLKYKLEDKIFPKDLPDDLV